MSVFLVYAEYQYNHFRKVSLWPIEGGRESHDGADDEQHKLLNIQQERRWTQVDILKKIFCRISLRSKRRKAIVTSWAVIGVTEIAGIT